MNAFKNIFWNTEEARLRAGYRILLALTVYRIVWVSLGSIIGTIPGIPLGTSGEEPFWYFLVPAGIRLSRVVISVWLAGRFLDHRPFADFGLHLNNNWWKDLGFGMGLGILLMGSIFTIEYYAGWVTISETIYTANPGQPFILSIMVFVVLFVCVGFSEELFYRGYFLTNLAEGFNLKSIGPQKSIIIAVTLSSVLFGFFHMGNPNA